LSPQGTENTPDPESKPPRRDSFLVELKKRQVYQAAGAYAVIAWGATEILDGVISRFGWPDWLATLAVIFFVVGFPVAMFLAWIFDWTPRGIRRDEPWTAMGWLSIVAAGIFLVAGSGGLFWLINPSGVARIEQVGVAVLPCRYRGEDEFAFRAEGIAGVLSDRLAHIEQLHVPAFSSVLDLSARNIPTSKLGALAGVSSLVDCRFTRAGEDWQIDVSLVDVSTDESALVINLDIGANEPLAALEPVTPALLGKLGLSQSALRQQAWMGRFPAHARSIDAYLLGEQAMRLATVEAYRQAREHFRAAQNGPAFELARVREADAFMGLLDLKPPDSARELDAGLRAIGLMLDAVERSKPGLAELYAARMRLEILSAKLGAGKTPDIQRQQAWFDSAVELKPSYADPYRLLARVLQEAGEEKQARALLARAQILDPAG
jgi:TolB-like protein